MRTRRPPLYSVLALWLSCTLSATAQEFYIELRGPDTPAAQNPSAPASETPPAPARPGRYGPITTTDTLWSIAGRHTQAPATVQQTMVALYYLNPGAFVRGNINYLQRGAMLRLPTLSQARQRSPREAENEFRRLSRQGNRSVTQAQARPAARPTEAPQPVRSPAPAVATPPVVKSEPAPVTPSAPVPAPVVASKPVAEKVAQAPGLSEPRAARPAPAAEPVSRPEPDAAKAEPASQPATPPEQSEQVALERLQARLLDELREQVAMSNEQLAQLADNNQALRHRLGQLTAEVNELKMVRTQQATPEANAAVESGGWFSELLRQPLNLALLLTLPALLLLALFTLWWRKRLKEDLAEQDEDSSSLMMDDEHNDFDDLFATELSTVDEAPQPQTAASGELEEIDEDAFARFLEEQERLEREEAEPAGSADTVARPEAEPEEVLFDDAGTESASNAEAVPEDTLFDDAAADSETAFDDDLLFDDAMARSEADMAFDDDLEESLFGNNANKAGMVEDDDTVFDQKATVAGAEPVQDGQPQRPLSAEGETERDESFNDNVNEALFDKVSTEDGITFDDKLFDLDYREEEPAFKPAVRSEPVSLAEQGAFEEDVSSRFDDVLAASMAEQQTAKTSAMNSAGLDDASPFPGEREPSARHELDDYADLLGNGQEVDIDLDEGGMGAKLDLARAYIEIDDLDSARELLTEALEKGNEQQQNDARKLLQRLDRR